ncbi:MAG: 50S ribosomal protein L15 [Candidatus Omnitrophota bacterium]|nr:50S ribosomal protein L15 [Candidatus Omnitrophota bacterium]
MKINEIGAPIGVNRKTKRRGRGSGSGHGKTSCRGRKGALKRSGRTTRPGFEGGQMQLVRRIPKRGFNYPFKNFHQIVNVESLNRFENNSTVGPAEFKNAGLISSEKELVKILGDGKLTKNLTVKAHALSGSAKKKLEAAGSKFEFLTAKVKKTNA